MLVGWVAAGFDPDRFWQLTFAEVDREMRGAQRRAIRVRQETIAQAWWTENLARHKKLPDLGKLLADVGPKRKQTGEEMLALAKQMFIFMGGDPKALEKK